jgi:SPP1 gp7 family putative phage head morphogenesis protein
MRKKTLKLLNIKAAKDVETEEYMEERRDLIAFTVPIYERALRYGAGTLAEEIDVSSGFSLSDALVIYYLTNIPLRLTRIIDTIKDDIRKQLQQGAAKNETVDELAGRFRGVFASATKRVSTISTTEISRALNYARSIEMQKSNYKMKIWFTALDEKVRPTHRKMHGLSIPIGQSWVLGSGSTLRFPGDPMGSAAETINCRCIELIDTKS